jgi:hypothetical protein
MREIFLLTAVKKPLSGAELIHTKNKKYVICIHRTKYPSLTVISLKDILSLLY